MAITTSAITNYIILANAALEVNMLAIVNSTRMGKKNNAAYFPNRWLSGGIDVLSSNHGLTNLQVEVIIQQMIEQGNLNDLSGNPIPYTIN